MPRAKTHLIYGESGTYKTTNAGFFARWIYKRYGKRTRMVSADGGGWAPIQHYVNAGLIIPYAVGNIASSPTGSPSPMATIRKLARGEWPKPVTVSGKTYAKFQPTTPEEWQDIGAYIVEGLTSIGDLEMEELRRDQRSVGEDAVGKWQTIGDLSDTPEKFSANNRAHYNVVQNEVFTMVRAFGSLPVGHVLFTAHEGKGEEADSKESIRGPAVVGKAATAKVPTWVGDCLHFESYLEPKQITVVEGDKKFTTTMMESVVRAYFVRHPDQRFSNISYPAKPRVPAELVGELFKRWQGGYIRLATTEGLDALLDFEEELEQQAFDRLMVKLTEGDSPVVVVK